MTFSTPDHLLDLIDVRLDAFAVCEIGRTSSLKCDPNESVVVHFVLRGQGFLVCEQGEFELAAGSVILVPKMLRKSLRGVGPIEHVHEAEATCPLADGLVSFRPIDGQADLVLGCAVLSTTLGGDNLLFGELQRPMVHQTDEGALAPLFGMMLQELSHPRTGTRAMVSAMMKQIIIVLLRSVRPDDSAPLAPVMNPRLARVLATVLSRPQDSYTVDSLAASAGMSRSRFSHHFSAACHCSPKEFVQAVRLSSAAKLLKGSDLPVKSVAASVGYASRSHFSRAFQAKYGIDPSGFRRTSAAGPE